jgi:hypothetical protein
MPFAKDQDVIEAVGPEVRSTYRFWVHSLALVTPQLQQ